MYDCTIGALFFFLKKKSNKITDQYMIIFEYNRILYFYFIYNIKYNYNYKCRWLKSKNL